MDIKALALEAESYIIDRRRYYHQHPEITDHEVETRAQIHKDLEALGITDIKDTVNCYGLFATIHGGKPGKTVALRADIDALTVQEQTGLPFASVNDGVMHACGHDTHIAMLLGAAKILNEHRDELSGNVRLIFQPAEEFCTGAYKMIAEGCLEGVDAIYGAHIWGNFDAPFVSIDEGPRMALADLFEIDVDGVAAHGSAPNLGVDAITAAAAIVQNLQQHVSRVCDPLSPAVVTIGTIKGGSRFNVIANHVRLEASIRAYSAANHQESITRIVEKTAEALGAKATVYYHHTITPVWNDCPEMNKLARNAVTKLYGADTLKELPKMLGSEDFAAYREHVPGVFAFIGIRNK